MKSIERIIDHLIVLASPAQMVEISNLLEKAGLQVRDEVVEASLGVRSRLLPIAGGGFIEVASELSRGSFAHAKHGNPFDITPRLVSVSYTTDDVVADLARWRGIPGAQNARAQAGGWRRQDGTFGYFVGVSPTPLAGDVFFGLQERRLFPLPYLDSARSAPAVRQIKVAGPDAGMWKQRHAQLFALPQKDGVLRAGATELLFQQESAAATQITATLAVSNPNVAIPLAAGRFDFVPSNAAGSTAHAC